MMNKVKVTLEKDLRKKLGIRQFPIMRGDIVKIIKGSRRGEGGKVSSVDHRHSLVIIDGINIAKADGKEKSFPIQPEKIEITKLDLNMEERSERIRELAAMKNIVLNDQVLEEYSTKNEPEAQEEIEQPQDETTESQTEKVSEEEPEEESEIPDNLSEEELPEEENEEKDEDEQKDPEEDEGDEQ
ncbi:50S ribosomal protein L24 [Cuniculiplasma divulgatum]|uniref:50S ribosomal protein L24 n=1 Tax=Cuniculiplasma divulgatum TaxID=1673428 RepID=A0A1N5VXZ4_9ARCH|nr:50S ribosomal protein L24 [Cuniculiplasma divulgatum]SIM77868.1 50S ribosomal protein L24p [Cuniculiplasma divulgatum]